ncbi:hypothetical protein, partial [Pseudomonas coronafaciens]|uniref:hypothetical protein n=1 Tax=Pseudomonas coronafaciens TaxID=53409 RepID=UPI001C7FAC40
RIKRHKISLIFKKTEQLIICWFFCGILPPSLPQKSLNVTYHDGYATSGGTAHPGKALLDDPLFLVSGQPSVLPKATPCA